MKKFRIITSILAVLLAVAMYAIYGGGGNSGNYNSGSGNGAGSDFSADSISSMRN